jgi:hypothetical protein
MTRPHGRIVPLWSERRTGRWSSATVTFEDTNEATLLMLQETYPGKEALDAAGTSAAEALVATFDQLDALLVALGARPATQAVDTGEHSH